MSKKRLVIALGGNALGKTPEEQLELVTKTAESIVDLSEEYDLAIGHGTVSYTHLTLPTILLV